MDETLTPNLETGCRKVGAQTNNPQKTLMLKVKFL